MKSYKQFVVEAPTVGVAEPVNQTGGSDTYDIQHPDVLKRVNAFVGSIADREYLIPENALNQLKNFLERIGLEFEMPKLPDGNSRLTVELRRYGGIYGKSVDTPHNEIESERGTDKSLSIRVEKMQNHSWKVYAEIV
tara:strand:+ start:364 stop:774 length:411 start_codon:yes stop_codon:yes gene_type:complete